MAGTKVLREDRQETGRELVGHNKRLAKQVARINDTNRKVGVDWWFWDPVG